MCSKNDWELLEIRRYSFPVAFASACSWWGGRGGVGVGVYTCAFPRAIKACVDEFGLEERNWRNVPLCPSCVCARACCPSGRSLHLSSCSRICLCTFWGRLWVPKYACVRVTISPPLPPLALAFAERRSKSFSRSWSDPTPVKTDSPHEPRDSESTLHGHAYTLTSPRRLWNG